MPMQHRLLPFIFTALCFVLTVQPVLGLTLTGKDFIRHQGNKPVRIKDSLLVVGNLRMKAGKTVDGYDISTLGASVTALQSSSVYTAGSGLALADNQFSLLTSCTANQILKFDGSAWQCAADVDTDTDTDTNTTYTAGSGISITGTSIAASLGTTIESSEITDSTIATADILDGTLLSADIATDAVTTTEILDGTVLSADIAADVIVAADIATDAVTTAEILDGTVASADIATDTIVAADIATDAVTTTEILDETITASDIGTDAVTGSEVMDETITSADIANISRAISFPLRSFTDCQTDAGADIGFDATADTLPDFETSDTDGTGMVIRFDDTSGTEDQDSEICNNFTVPIDYDSGGLFKIRILKDGATVTNSEKINCAVSVNGGALQSAGSTTISSASSTSVNCSATIASLTFYDSVSFTLYITSSGTMDDTVDIAGVAFIYNATQ